MKKNIILFLVSFAMFMEAVDTTIINTAIPVMASSLNVDPVDLKLALISYLLSLAIFIPISGWIADKFGIKKVFIAALSLFTLSSIWCGLTDSLWTLVLARILQGVGGSFTMPLGRLIILRVFERHELVSKMMLVVMFSSVGMMLGPLLGGLITTHFSWRWIFWVNVPVGLLAVILSSFLLPRFPKHKVPPLDKMGFILFGSGLATLTFSLSMFSESHFTIMNSIMIFLIAVLLLLAYLKYSHRKTHPVVNIALLRARTFRTSVIGNLLGRLSFGGIPFLLPLLLQIVLGYSPQVSGLMLTPIALGVFVVRPLSMYILRYFGYKKLLMINTVLVSLSLCSFFTITPSSSYWSIGLLTFIYGFLISLQYTGMNSLAYANIKEHEVSSATSIMSTIQQLAQSFGVAISALLITFFSWWHHSNQELTLQMFHNTFLFLGLFTLLSGIIFTSLKKEDGSELVRHFKIKPPNTIDEP